MSLNQSSNADPSQDAAAVSPPRWSRWLGRPFLYAPRWLWLAFLGISLLLVLFPGIDLAVSNLFYTPEVGFTARGIWFERLVHASTYWLLILGVPALIGLWWVNRQGGGRVSSPGSDPEPGLNTNTFSDHDAGPSLSLSPSMSSSPSPSSSPRPGRFTLSGRDLAYLLLVLALGPGLIVNGLLKEQWGRARPVNCVDFGGAQVFTPAFVVSDQGGKSFSSGHAAGSAYWVVVALVLARGPRRRYWLGLAIGYSLLVAWARLAAGGHFFSDILVSWFILALLAWGLYGSRISGFGMDRVGRGNRI